MAPMIGSGLFFGSGLPAAGSVTYSTPGTYAFTVPRVLQITVAAIAGGGGGGGSSNSSSGGSSGSNGGTTAITGLFSLSGGVGGGGAGASIK